MRDQECTAHSFSSETKTRPSPWTAEDEDKKVKGPENPSCSLLVQHSTNALGRSEWQVPRNSAWQCISLQTLGARLSLSTADAPEHSTRLAPGTNSTHFQDLNWPVITWKGLKNSSVSGSKTHHPKIFSIWIISG